MRILLKELGLGGGNTEQEITIGSSAINLTAVRPHIYIHNSPAGSLKLQLLDSDKKLIAESETKTIADLKTQIAPESGALAFVHGRALFDLNIQLQASTNYWIRLESTGYTFAESAYVGWVNDYDLRVVDTDYGAGAGFSGALLMELWSRDRIVRDGNA